MKKLFTSSILSLLALSYAFAWEGSGTEASPYLIKSASDLLELAQSDADVASAMFQQTQDIDCSSIAQWIPIGLKNPFKGYYDGKNYSIKNLRHIAPNGQQIGLFGKTEDCQIKNVVIDASCYFEGKKEVGALVGSANKSWIIGCVNNATVYSNAEYSSEIGGLIGSGVNVLIVKCQNNGLVLTTKDNSARVGGIIGSLTGDDGKIDSCQNKGTVRGGGDDVGGIVGNIGGTSHAIRAHNQGSVNGSNRVGGVAGIAQIGLIESAYILSSWNSGNVSGKEKVGGVVGSSIEAEDVCNIGDVTASSSTVGGVIGSGNVKFCYNKGTVQGVDFVGGIAGSIGEIEQAYNRGTVIGSTNVGGLVGAMPGTENKLKYSYAASTMVVKGTATSKGALVGSLNRGGFINSNEIKNCYWDQTLNNMGGVGNFNDTSSQGAFIYSGKNTADLTGESYPIIGTFWSYDSKNENDGYPVMDDLSDLIPVKLPEFTVTVTSGNGGSVNLPSSLKVVNGGAAYVCITPDPQFAISSISINGVTVETESQITLSNISENKNIEIKFADAASVDEAKSTQNIRLIGNSLQITKNHGAIVLLYNTQGALISKHAIESDSQSISLYTLQKGAYFVRLSDRNGNVETTKIIR